MNPTIINCLEHKKRFWPILSVLKRTLSIGLFLKKVKGVEFFQSIAKGYNRVKSKAFEISLLNLSSYNDGLEEVSKDLEKERGPMTLESLLTSHRKCEKLTQEEMEKMIGLSRANI